MRLRRLTFMRSCKPSQPVQAIDALLADCPAFALEHHQHAKVTESWTVHGNLPDAQTQRALIARLALLVPDRRLQYSASRHDRRTFTA